MPIGAAPINLLFSIICPIGANLWLTNTGSVIGAASFGGIDPDAMTAQDETWLATTGATVLSGVPENVAVTTYYLHLEGARVALRERAHPISSGLSRAREAALNARGLADTRLVMFFEARDRDSYNSGFWKSLGQNLLAAPFEREARQLVKARLSAPAGIIIRERELGRRAETLRQVISDATKKWSVLMDAQVLDRTGSWRVMKYIATMNPLYLDESQPLFVPSDDCDLALADGDIESVQVAYTDMLKLHGTVPRYLRYASVIKSPDNPIGLWSLGSTAPVKSRGNYVIATHFASMSAFTKALTFSAARNRLERMRIDMRALFMSDQDGKKDKQSDSFAIRQKREELEKAEAVDDRWGESFSTIGLSDTDPQTLIDQTEEMGAILTGNRIQVAWEAAGLPLAYRALQPGGQHQSKRKSIITLSRAAALGLYTRPATGTRYVEELEEEAQYILESQDGTAFHLSPYVGGRNLMIAIGPPRSGKTFSKNTFSAHFLKYGGFLRAIDIDPGTETLARAFGDDGAVVRLDPGAGLNPFSTGAVEGDTQFSSHIIALTKAMLLANDTEIARQLDVQEQGELDRAIVDTVRLKNPELRTLAHMIGALPQRVQAKFARWTAGGSYDGILTVKKDAIGSLTKPLAVLNIERFKDTPVILQPVMLELFYRTVKLFEAPEYRHLPKHLDIDEAHHLLKTSPQFVEFFVGKARTWPKWNASIALWSQSPQEYADIKGWDAVRSAASTFLFYADPRMNEDLYKRVFGITDGMCQAIRTLVPQREVFIVQPELGIAKRCLLVAEPEQIIINTSKPREVAVRDRLIAEHGVEEGLRRAVVELTEKQEAA